MNPNCPKCGNEDFDYRLVDHKIQTSKFGELLVFYVWIFCNKCGCVVGIVKEDEPNIVE